MSLASGRWKMMLRNRSGRGWASVEKLFPANLSWLGLIAAVSGLPGAMDRHAACLCKVAEYGKAHRLGWALCYVWCGGVLLSHTLSGAVPSPCQVLASGFGMGPGVSPGPWPPQIFNCPSPPFLGVRVVWLFGDRWVDATRVCVRDRRPSVWLVWLAQVRVLASARGTGLTGLCFDR